jgi:hypothetical protein
MSYLFIKNLFQREKFVLFSKKIKNLKKPKKTFLVSFLSGFFGWVFLGFFMTVFYCQPCLGHVTAGLLSDAHRDAPQGAGLVRRAAGCELGLK